MKIAWVILGVGAAVGCGGGSGTGGGGAGSGTLPPPASHARTMSSGLPPDAWVDRTPCPTPVAWPPRINTMSTAYDTKRNRVVALGATFFRQEVWELDPDSGAWENRTPCDLPASWPAPHIEALVGYDQGRGRTVMFGRTGPSIAWETWEWDGVAGTWEMRSPDFPWAGGPDLDSIVVAELEYDPQRRTMVLPGWTLWDWDGARATWTARWTAPIDVGTPPGGGGGWRSQMSFGYDPDRSSLFVFGGEANGYEQILYEFDGASWTNRAPMPLPAGWPSARGGARMFYEPATKRMVIAGGCALTCVPDDLWAWDPATGAWTAAPAPAAGWPLSGEVFASAGGSGRAITFDNGPRDDPWLGPAAIWNLATGERRDLRGERHVTIRWPITPLPTAAYDPSRQRVVVFGGGSATPTLVSNANLIEWNGRDGTWEDRTPEALPGAWPGPRQQAAMAADSRRGRVSLFGGRTITPGPSISVPGYIGPTLSDLWEWDGKAGAWTARSAAPTAAWPAATYGAAMTYDEPRDRLVLAGTGDGAPWEWNPSGLGWTAPPSGAGTSGDRLSLVFDLPRDRTVLVVGSYPGVSEWDGASRVWTSRWPTQPPTSGPLAGQGGPAAADPISGLTWLASTTSLWAWSGAAGAWSDHSAAAGAALPGSDEPPVMVFDESRGTLVLLLFTNDVAGHPVLRLFERAVP